MIIMSLEYQLKSDKYFSMSYSISISETRVSALMSPYMHTWECITCFFQLCSTLGRPLWQDITEENIIQSESCSFTII